jgi:DedD protein
MAQNNSADAPGEADEQLKKRARRRLVGAIALVLFAVIVLPMVMDHEPRTAGPEIQVRIPSQDGAAFEGRGSSPKASKAAADTPSVSEKSGSAITKPEHLVVASESKPDSKPEAKSEVKSEAKSETKPDTKTETKSEAKDGKKSDAAESSRAAAALAGGASESGGDQWVVQLGAYSEVGRVKVLLAKLKEIKLPAYTEKVDTPQGARTRVRAGPFSSRDAALKAQERAKIIGVSGPVAAK